MGEVYLATDSKLDREVAIKVLPPAFAQNKERLARFEREAKVLAQLSHPNIASVFDFDQDDGTWFLAMECVEGDDLSVRLKQGALSVEESLSIARQVAEALEAAHAKGIVHRDLKPANIKLDPEGRVKVLDFGLAKALADDEVGRAYPRAAGQDGRSPAPGPASEALGGNGSRVRSPHQEVSPEDSPTITDAFTQPGTILGTAAYMSPEQAKGKAVDQRADIWAFGCLLFECLTGSRAFAGEDSTETLASIIKGEPDWNALPATIPLQVQWLLQKCLAKDRKHRLHDIADARIDLDGRNLSDEVQAETAHASKPSWSYAIATIATAAIAAVLGWVLKPEAPIQESLSVPRSPRHYSLSPDMEGELAKTNGSDVRLSPDGQTMGIIFHEEGREEAMIFLKQRDEPTFKALEGTDRAIDFDFSPDGEWIVFRREGPSPYWRIRTDFSGPPILYLEHSGASRGISWSDAGIVFDSGDREVGLQFQRTDDEDTRSLASPTDGFRHHWPNALSNGRGALTSLTSIEALESIQGSDIPATRWDLSDIMFVPYDGGEIIPIHQGGYQGRYLPSKHLVYIHRATLFAAPFDIDTLEMRGTPVPVVQNIAVKDRTGVAHYDVSNDGTLAYLQGNSINEGYALSWVERNGKRSPMSRETFPMFRRFRLSPDGSRIAFVTRDFSRGSQSQKIVLYSIKDDTIDGLTEEDESYDFPVWNWDNRSIIFVSQSSEGSRLYWAPVDRSRPPQLLKESEQKLTPVSWSQDGRYLAVTAEAPSLENKDILLYELTGDSDKGWTVIDTIPFRSTSANEQHPHISPNGRWLAYYQERSGAAIGQCYVRSLPDGEKWRPIGGLQDYRVPSWLNDQELLLGGKNIYKVSFTEEQGQPLNGAPELWDHSETARMMTVPNSFDRFDVDELNDRLLVRTQGPQTGGDYMLKRIMVFENFFDYLKEKVPYPD